MNERSTRLGAAIPYVVAAGFAGMFVLLRDAQWLKYDDFWMMQMFRSKPAGELLREILAAATGPYVRFAFLEHVLFLPFYRGWFDHRAAVDLVYFAVTGSSLAAAWLLSRPLRRRPLAWLAAWLSVTAALLTVAGWNTFEFKTASYLVLGFAMVAVLEAVGRKDAPASRAFDVGWFALAALAAHMAEVTLLVTVPLSVALVLRRRLSPWAAAAVPCYAAAYWFAVWLRGGARVNPVQETAKPVPLLGGTLQDALAGTLRNVQAHFVPEIAILSVLVAIALVTTWGKHASEESTRRKLSRTVEVLAFPIGAAAFLFAMELNSAGQGAPGFLEWRHELFMRLTLAGGIVVAFRSIELDAGVGQRLALGVRVGLVLCAVAFVASRVPRFAAYAAARRMELASTMRLAGSITAERRRMQEHGVTRPLLVIVPSWITSTEEGDFVDPTFLWRTWSRDAFSDLYTCPGGSCPPVAYVGAGQLPQTTIQDVCRGVLGAGSVLVARADGNTTPLASGGWSLDDCRRWVSEIAGGARKGRAGAAASP